MENIILGQNIDDVFDDLFVESNNITNNIVGLACKKSEKPKLSLSSKVRYTAGFSGSKVVLTEELSDKKVYKIASDLALAIDKNNPLEVKHIKAVYGYTEEFAKAKDFLNRACKEVWDVFENKNTVIKVPKEAMKVLGITNKPTLEFLLADSIKYYEKDNGNTTARIISSILNNPNLDYTIDDIFDYLKANYDEKRYHYNFETMKLLAEKTNNDLYRLGAITSDKEIMKKYYKSLSLRKKLKIIFSILFNVADEWITLKT